MQEKYINIKTLKVSEKLSQFISDELLKETDLSVDNFWSGFEKTVNELAPKNKELINLREDLQKQIDNWHVKNKGNEFNLSEYKKFLTEIGYLKEEGDDFEISTQNVDEEITSIAGPQLVVPVMNARYALNAANARWMSLYDSLYGTDVIEQSEDSVSERYDPLRGEMVIKYGRDFLDKYFPLAGLSWQKITSFAVKYGKFKALKGADIYDLVDENKFIGHRGEADNPSAIILKNNNLHIEILRDRRAFSAQQDYAGISDIILESAISTICDNEDSVAAVDAADKVICYRNWLGLMKGTLKTQFEKGGKLLERKLNPNRSYISKDGKGLKLHGRSLLLIRNVGHLMTNPSIILSNGNEVPEGIMDAFITVAAALHDLKNKNNSRTGSIYIVKPKMHGPEEVKFTDDLFSHIEDLLELPNSTIKIGIMDEERRTSINLKECIRAAQSRVAFINTGFLDRTGDEIHTGMQAGSFMKKNDMKNAPWISSYEKRNVSIGLECGLKGKAQIGKGMWAMPDLMAEMMKQKISHPKSGANCAWVPSPTAATLHAIHYHQVLVSERQETIKSRNKADLNAILTIPLLEDASSLSEKDIQDELDNNCQGILGYVVRWVDLGVGCSKVPDINNVGLMEDRATCRISSQHIANWLHHKICSEEQVLETMKKMAVIVDKQNEGDSEYTNMAPDYKGVAFSAACDLALKGRVQPSGYTEPILHSTRLLYKS